MEASLSVSRGEGGNRSSTVEVAGAAGVARLTIPVPPNSTLTCVVVALVEASCLLALIAPG